MFPFPFVSSIAAGQLYKLIILAASTKPFLFLFLFFFFKLLVMVISYILGNFGKVKLYHNLDTTQHY